MISSKWLQIFLVFIVGLVVGLVPGAYYGAEKAMAFGLDACLYKDTLNIKSRVETLGHIRRHQLEEAMANLEIRIDDDLIMFDPEEPYAGISADTVAEIKQSIERVKQYRQAHPRVKPRPGIDRMVDDFLGRGYAEK